MAEMTLSRHFAPTPPQNVVSIVSLVINMTSVVYLANVPVDLTRIQHSALLTNEYKHLPILGMCLHKCGYNISMLDTPFLILASERLPEMDDVVLAFRTSASAKEGPYFEGYCGEHISHHPGIEQKAGSFRYDGKYYVSYKAFYRG